MTDDLIAFLRARLDEDKTSARQAKADLTATLKKAGQDVAEEYGDADPPDGEVSTADRAWWTIQDAVAYIARHDPARVLADVEAKQRIIAEHFPIDPCDAHDAALRSEACDTLLLLALPYADHSEYREEWHPTER